MYCKHIHLSSYGHFGEAAHFVLKSIESDAPHAAHFSVPDQNVFK
jgi:hypothetical protein